MIPCVGVLRQRLDCSDDPVTEMLRHLPVAAEVVVGHAEELEMAILGPEAAIPDFSDRLVAWSARKGGCRKVMTFDRKAAEAIPEMELLT